jgi:predicted N-acetyltransferase YhbS
MDEWTDNTYMLVDGPNLLVLDPNDVTVVTDEAGQIVSYIYTSPVSVKRSEVRGLVDMGVPPPIGNDGVGPPEDYDG